MADEHSTCSVESCDRPRNCRGWCSYHYIKWRNYGDPLSTKGRLVYRDGARCSIDGCDGYAHARGWCQKHWNRWRRTGDPLKVRKPVRNGRPTMSTDGNCAVAGCDKDIHCRGHCRDHYYKLWTHGDPLAGKTKTRKAGEGTINNGYHFTTVVLNGKRRSVGTHRLVLEQLLGRRLRATENVHHINGKRDDNRPENLELWVKTQPCGQRPADLVTWAREIIALYGAEVDRSA